MADKSEKKKGGAGKFFLGAVLGSIAGAIAGRFITAKAEEDAAECKCGECPLCKKKEDAKPVEKATPSKKAQKATSKK